MNMIPDEGKYSLKRYKGIITTLIIAIVVFFALWRLDSVVAVANKYLGYISPVIYGVSIAYVLNPAVVYFERMLRARFMKAKSEKTRAKADRLAKNLSIAIVITLAIAAIVVLCLMIIPSMLESIIDLAKQIVPLINSLVDRIDKFTSAESRFGDSLQSVIEKVSSALQEWITTNLLPTAQSALEYITSSVAAVLVFLYNFLVGIIVAVYALAEKKNFVAVAKKLTYVLWNPKHANRVVDTARHVADAERRIADQLYAWIDLPIRGDGQLLFAKFTPLRVWIVAADVRGDLDLKRREIEFFLFFRPFAVERRQPPVLPF